MMENPITQMYACIFRNATLLRTLPQLWTLFILKLSHIDVMSHIF